MTDRFGKPSTAFSDGAAALVDELADVIQLRVLTGDYRKGTRLRQEELAQEFGVSRTPVREALRKLQAGGVVEVVPHRGAIVRGPSVRDLREAYLVRAELEGVAAELAARWITDPELEELARASELFAEAIGSFSYDADGTHQLEVARQWVRANDMFHGVIGRASRNLQLQRTIGDLLQRSLRPRDATWSVLSHDRRLLRTNLQQHRDILHALERRDGALARQAMREHILHTGEYVATWFEQQYGD